MFNFYKLLQLTNEKRIDFLGGVQTGGTMAAELEGILGRLLYPDSGIIRQVESTAF